MGKAKVGVAVIVNVGVIVGVKVIVGVNVSVGMKVEVGTGVCVHEAAVAVSDVAVSVACCSGDGAHAVMNNRNNRIIFNLISFLLSFMSLRAVGEAISSYDQFSKNATTFLPNTSLA